MPPEGSTRAEILPGCPSLDRGIREAEVGFEPRTFRSPGSLRQQDIVVLNSQTGEVLGSRTQPVQKISLMSGGQSPKVDIMHTSSGDGVNGTTTQQPINTPDTPAAQGTQPYSYRVQQDGGGGGASPRGGGAGGSGGSNGHMMPYGSVERGRQVYSMAECQMAQLTVFMDRAQVCRRIRPRFNASEITEVLFEHLSPAIDKDSIRVEIRGAATILDVTFVARSLADEEDTWAHAINQLTAELRQCHRQAESLSGRLARASKQRLVLDTFADNLIRKDEENATGASATAPSPLTNHVGGTAPAPPIHGSPSPLLAGEHKGSLEVINPYDPRSMDTLHRFLGMYEEQAERLDATLLDTSEEMDQVQARIEAIEKEIHEIELKQDEHLARELSVLVEPRETGQVEMLISYVVGKCSWRPAYDIRIFNSDGTMKIVYYGMVQQATGENWETRSMALSTTLPGTGGTVPPLGLQRVHFKKDPSPATPTKPPLTNTVAQLPPPSVSYGTMTTRPRSTSKVSGFRKSARQTTTSFHEADRILSDHERDAPTPAGTLQRGHSTEVAPSSSASRGSVSRMHSRRALGTSMLFHAPSSPTPLCPPRGTGPNAVQSSNPTQLGNSANIPTVHLEVPRPPGLVRCDNQPVRVTVGLLDLQPRYEYVTVPKRSLHAFLKATAVNRSDFSILAGETNIYADNTFIGKSEIPAVAQGEEFSCNLGAEQGIKVCYRPLFKYRESAGSNSKHATLTFKQLIEVRNTFDRPIRLMVMDQVPLSCEDKIKINLLEPVIKHPEKYDRNKPIRMNKSNNVEWDLDLGPGETKELTLKYSIEHPANEDLDVSVSEA
ncbi:Protein f37c4.5 [Clonorchis sinensis]|uniref:Protein f37c4.5 n=1 Tax=Clonorchis sinensis TaxID=79923 RepID=A0A8T1M2X1_CLOSI|nr:Protein f37c4.5 [Clonorchis sinensis]